MNRVVHFEIQADDVQRAQKFYQSALGWNINQVMTKDQGGMDYWMIETGEGPGINGGLYQRPASEGERFFLYDCTIQVEDLDKTVESLKKNGGTITREKSLIPGVGWFAGAMDPEGNRFGLMQATDWKPQ